jgi:type I restriction enzyme S subunit
VYYKHLHNLWRTKTVILYHSLPEQTTIVEIPSDMDAEIAALEGKLSKARQVKQGMMSELLTGRVRLVKV